MQTQTATATQYAAPCYHAPHMVPYANAMAFIRDHGHRVFLTKEGLLSLTEEAYTDPQAAGVQPDDAWCEAPMVFEVDEDGLVSSRAVREWLGY